MHIARQTVDATWVPAGQDSWDLHMSFPAVVSSVEIGRRALVGQLRGRRVDELILERVALAASEACTNAVMHAYPDERDGEYSIDVRHDGDTVHVLVADGGTGLRPRLDSPGLGVGIAVIAQACSSLEVRSSDSGTTVVMTFAVDASVDQGPAS